MRANSSAPLVSLPANEAMHVPWHRVWKLWQLLGAQFFGTIVLMKFVLSLPVKLCMSHRPTFANHWKSWAHNFFGTIALMKFVLKTRANSSASQYVASSQRSSPQAISHGVPSVHPVVIPASLLPTGALPKLFPTVSLPPTLSSLPYRSVPTELSPSYISHGFRPPCRLPYRSFQPELSPSYFPRFPFRPPCRHSRIAPSHRSSPQAISHGFPSVHPLVASVSLRPNGALPKLYFPRFPSTLSSPVSLLPTGALPKLFPTVSLPSTLSSFPYHSFPPDRSSPQAISHGFCRHISHGFPSVHPVVTPVSLLP